MCSFKKKKIPKHDSFGLYVKYILLDNTFLSWKIRKDRTSPNNCLNDLPKHEQERNHKWFTVISLID